MSNNPLLEGHLRGSIGGFKLYEVEAGTEIEDPLTGETLEVTDDAAVFGITRAYVTPAMLERLREHIDAAQS